MANHSNILSGSRAVQRINCPGSYQLEQKVNAPDTGSDYAREGSMLHAAMELILTSELRGEALMELVGQTMGHEYADMPVTRDHVIDKLGPATEAFWGLVEQFGLNDWFTEARVSLDSEIAGAHGTCDVLAKDKTGMLWVIDWKFGDGIGVEAEGNYQLGFYAAAALYDEDEEYQEFTKGVTDVVLAIIQPRRGANQVIDMWPTSVAWVDDLVDLAAEAVRLAQSLNPPFKAGSHCRFCTARPICPAHIDTANDMIKVDPKAATSIELATLLTKAVLMRDWANSVFDLAEREAESGVAIPGWKMVEKLPRRKWVDEEAAEALMRRKFGVKLSFKKELLSPAQAEKLDKGFYAAKLDACVESKSSGLTLVPDSDKRPAVVNSMGLLANALKGSLLNTGSGK
jgi:hypothetical protein